jgi:parallel beta-helix repeat protein
MGTGYSGHGICVYNTSTTLSNIIIKNVNVRFWESGILLERVEESVIENNTAYSNGKGIKLLRSSNNSITKNSISRSSIYLMDSTNNCITNNNASQSSIYLERSNHNTITKNNVCNNGNPGISLYSSNNNLIYLNNFIDNSYSIGSSYSSNTFNSTNPIPYNYHIVEITGYMGNYWSDYNDIDTNGDGIWDNPYIISLDNDNYPLVEPFELYFTD